jgi:hypothetical protein
MSTPTKTGDREEFARDSVGYADTLLAELAKQRQEGAK